MLEHYVTQALRSFWRFRVTAAVNLLGLVLAVVCFIATYLFVDSLARSDMHFPKAARTYVITQELWNGPSRMVPAFPTSGPPTAAALRAEFPALETVARAVGVGAQTAATEDRKVDVFTAAIDPEFLEIFDLDFKVGDAASAMRSTHSAILTERTAERLFGTTDVLGRRVLLHTQVEVTITGVIKAVRKPSHMGDAPPSPLVFDLLVPMPLLKEMKTLGGIGVPLDPDSQMWGNDSFYTYVLFPENRSITPPELVRQLDAFAAHRANGPDSPVKSVFGAVPVSNVSLAFLDALYGNRAISVTSMIFLLDALVLAIACVNYANLAVAIATTRAKEIGVRKVLGATRFHLLRQYLVEAGLLGCAAIVIVVLFAMLVIEPINRALATSFTLASLLQPGLWLMVAGLLAAISLVGGLYPAIALSLVRPVDALRAGSVRAGPRFVPTILVGLQFAAASFLLVVALVMAQQNRLLQKQALQTGRDPVLFIGTNLTELNVSLDSLRAELMRNPRVKSVSSVMAAPWGSGGSHMGLASGPQADAPRADTIFNFVGNDFFPTMGLQLLAGRLLDVEHGDVLRYGDTSRKGAPPILVDRALAASLGWRDPNAAVNEMVYIVMNSGAAPAPWRIVGVVEDGYPRLIGPNTSSNAYGLSQELAAMPIIRISKEDIPGTVKYINSVWDSLVPKASSRLEFVENLFNVSYAQFARVNMVLNALAVFAFFIAVMGLCGLAIHVTSRRQREIGIRKTLGATAQGVVLMLLVDFAKPVLIANVIAWPFAWFVGRKYMDQFTQRGELTIWPFLLSLVITVGVAWASVGFQALRAATVKPAKVLYAQ